MGILFIYLLDEKGILFKKERRKRWIKSDPLEGGGGVTVRDSDSHMGSGQNT